MSGVVIYDSHGDVNNIADILNDTSKFLHLGGVDEFDKTAIQEQRIQRLLFGFCKDNLIPKNIYEKIHPFDFRDHSYMISPLSVNPMSSIDLLYLWLVLPSTITISGLQTVEPGLKLDSKHCIHDLKYVHWS